MAVAVAEFQLLLAEVAALAGTDVDTLLRRTDRLDAREAFAFLSEAYPEAVTPHLSASGDLSATYYEEQPGGLPGFIAAPADLTPTEQLSANARYALTQTNPVVALQGSATRAVFDNSRRTIISNAEREGVRWVRHARPGACGFCRMLATRSVTELGTLYRSEATGVAAGQSHIEDGHDHCTCLIVPDRDSAYTAPDYVHVWADDYQAARDAGANTVSAIVRFMEARGRERGDVEHPAAPLSRSAASSARGRGPVDLDRPPPPPPPTPPPATGSASGDGDDEWTESERARREQDLGIDTRGDKLTRREIEFVERFHSAGERLEWIPKDPQRKPTNDFVWTSNGGLPTELKSTKARYETIHGRLVDAMSRAARQGVRKENFVIDIGEASLTDDLSGRLAGFNVGRRKYLVARLWVMSDGVLYEIPLQK